MAHELDRDSSGRWNMFSVRETPWHRLGQVLSAATGSPAWWTVPSRRPRRTSSTACWRSRAASLTHNRGPAGATCQLGPLEGSQC